MDLRIDLNHFVSKSQICQFLSWFCVDQLEQTLSKKSRFHLWSYDSQRKFLFDWRTYKFFLRKTKIFTALFMRNVNLWIQIWGLWEETFYIYVNICACHLCSSLMHNPSLWQVKAAKLNIYLLIQENLQNLCVQSVHVLASYRVTFAINCRSDES